MEIDGAVMLGQEGHPQDDIFVNLSYHKDLCSEMLNLQRQLDEPVERHLGPVGHHPM